MLVMNSIILVNLKSKVIKRIFYLIKSFGGDMRLNLCGLGLAGSKRL
jgi:hypothetical protein